MSTCRVKLAKRDGYRFRCRAFVARFGTKKAFRGPPIETVLLQNVCDATTGEMLTDHLWFTCGKWSRMLSAGDTFEFEARVAEYVKGYQGERDIDDAPPVSTDWKLQRPTKVTVLPREQIAA